MLSGLLLLPLLVLPVLDSRLDGILSQHAAMKLDRRELQVSSNIGVLDSQYLINGLALDPFGGNRTAGNSGSTSKGLELGLGDLAIRANLDLQFHDITTSWGADETLHKRNKTQSE